MSRSFALRDTTVRSGEIDIDRGVKRADWLDSKTGQRTCQYKLVCVTVTSRVIWRVDCIINFNDSREAPQIHYALHQAISDSKKVSTRAPNRAAANPKSFEKQVVGAPDFQFAGFALICFATLIAYLPSPPRGHALGRCQPHNPIRTPVLAWPLENLVLFRRNTTVLPVIAQRILARTPKLG